MEQSRPRRRKTGNLSEPVYQQVNLYAVAAAAGGVAMLALTESATAEIVYTPTHTKITAGDVIALDLNNDGQEDFGIWNVLNSNSSFRSDQLNVVPSGANGILEVSHFRSALAAGVKVGPSRSFSSQSRFMAFGIQPAGGSSYCGGQWTDVQGRYLGLRFTIEGETHFGWARLNATCHVYKIEAVLTGYAYETVAGKTIVTGQTKDDPEQAASPASTPSLGTLAIGAGGLSTWRGAQPTGPEQ